MSPDSAWFLQARSDLQAALLLETHGGDTCQIIMHLQMCSEKLVKAYMKRSGNFRPTHQVTANYFRHLRDVVVADPNFRSALMGRPASRHEVFAVLRGLKRTMEKFESLNPSVARLNRPNCEYPWELPGTTADEVPPVRHRFGAAVGRAARAKMYRLLDRILTSEGV